MISLPCGGRRRRDSFALFVGGGDGSRGPDRQPSVPRPKTPPHKGGTGRRFAALRIVDLNLQGGWRPRGRAATHIRRERASRRRNDRATPARRGRPCAARHRGDHRATGGGAAASARDGTGRPRARRADANLARAERAVEPAQCARGRRRSDRYRRVPQRVGASDRCVHRVAPATNDEAGALRQT